jgi:hypothetical protein
MIFENALLALLCVLEALLSRGCVNAGNKELLLVVIVQKVPHVTVVDFRHRHVLLHLEFA